MPPAGGSGDIGDEQRGTTDIGTSSSAHGVASPAESHSEEAASFKEPELRSAEEFYAEVDRQAKAGPSSREAPGKSAADKGTPKLAAAGPSTEGQASASAADKGAPKLTKSDAGPLPGHETSQDAGTAGSEDLPEALPDSWDRVKDTVKSAKIEARKGKAKQKASRIGFSSFLQRDVQ